MKKYATSLLFICFLAISSHSSNAESKFTIDKSTRSDLNRIEKYLNELTTLDSQVYPILSARCCRGKDPIKSAQCGAHRI